jgi:hypothetical protein
MGEKYNKRLDSGTTVLSCKKCNSDFAHFSWGGTDE